MMLQKKNQAWVKDPFKMQDRPMDSNVVESESSLIRFLIPHSNLALRNYHLLSFGIVSKKDIHNCLKRLLKDFPFSSTYLPEAELSSFTSIKATYHSR